MQNPISKSPKAIQDTVENLRESAEQISSQTGAKVSQLANRTFENAGEYYNQATNWIQQNYGKTLGLVGVIAAAGTIGYMIGRNNQQRYEPQTPAQLRSS